MWGRGDMTSRDRPNLGRLNDRLDAESASTSRQRVRDRAGYMSAASDEAPAPAGSVAARSPRRVAAIVSIKRFDAAKQRLAGALDSLTRRALAAAMVSDVLAALRRTQEIDEVTLVTPEPAADGICRAHGASLLRERADLGYDGAVHPGAQRPLVAERGYNGAARAGIRRALDDGAERVLLMPGDCPLLDPAELSALLRHPAPARSVIIIPDRHGAGTNGLLLSPPEAIDPSFGPGSRERHEHAAAQNGVPCSVLELPSCMLDVDTADDIDALQLALCERPDGAPHTRNLLSRIEARRSA